MGLRRGAAGGGAAAGHLGLSLRGHRQSPHPSPHTPSPESSPARAGLPGSWHRARLAAERGQRGGASGGGAEDVAGRPGHEPDRGPEGEGTPGGRRVGTGRRQAGRRVRVGRRKGWGGVESGGGWGWGGGGGTKPGSARRRRRRRPGLPPSLWDRALRGGRACMGPGQAVALAGGRPRERGGARGCQGEKHPKACKLLLSAFFFFFLLLLGRGKKKKQCFLWRRMQKGCRLLTISCTQAFLSSVQARAWHGGIEGGRNVRAPDAFFWEMQESQAPWASPARSWARCAGVRTGGHGARGGPREQARRPRVPTSPVLGGFVSWC